MATQLKNIVRFIGIVDSTTTVLPHHLNLSGRALTPDILTSDFPDTLGLAITADDTNVTVINDTGSTIDVDVLCEYWHSIERAFGPRAVTDLAPKPFLVGGTGQAAPAPVFTGIRKSISNNTLTPLFSVDMDRTFSPPGLTPDYTWGGKLFFAAECADVAGERQIREGDSNVAVSLKLPATFASG